MTGFSVVRMDGWTKVGWLAITMTLGAACDNAKAEPDADPRCVDLTGPPSLEIGGGTQQTGFLDRQDGDEMTVILGPGGYYMVTPSIRAWGVYPGEAGRAGDPEAPMITIELFLQNERIGWSWPEHLGLTVTADGAQRLGIWVLFYDALALDTFLDQLVTLHAEITDVCGNTATDELDVLMVQ